MAEEIKYARPNWDEYFLDLIEPIGRRATCDRGRSGSIIVSPGNTIIATGYVGSPPGQPHCDEVGHMMNTVIHGDGEQSQHCVRTLHAEENAILQCAKDGIKLEGATIYSKMVPCYNCAMRIVRVGIKRVVSLKKYHADGLSRKLFKDAGVELVVVDDTVEEYKNQEGRRVNLNEGLYHRNDGFVSVKEILIKEGEIKNINIPEDEEMSGFHYA